MVTLAALAAPAVLLRRGLSATAESLGALASVLMILDAYALHRVAVPDADGPGFAAAASAVLAVLWAGYGLLLDRLRLPLPLAVVSAQLPLLLWAWSAGAGASVFGWALLLTAALDCAIAVRGPGLAVRVTACVGGWTTGLLGLAVALAQSVSADAVPDALAPAALLLAGAVIALFGAWRAPRGLAVVEAVCWPGCPGWPRWAVRCVPGWSGTGRCRCICCAVRCCWRRYGRRCPGRSGRVWCGPRRR